MSEALEVRDSTVVAVTHELSVEQVIARINKVHDVMKRAMTDGHHYGVIPGTPKPTLLKPGAELLCVMFRLDPQYSKETEREGEHLTITSTCTLWHIPTGQRMGSGMGSCSTRESKYAYRGGSRKCPKCGAATIIKGKAEYGGGWLCFAKKGGCGAKYPDKDPSIMEQSTERIANEDLADQENTVLKMSNKRALVAAVLNVTAASDIFTQDVEDLPREEAVSPMPPSELHRRAAAEANGEPIFSSPGAEVEQRAAQLFPDETEAEINNKRQITLGKLMAQFDIMRPPMKQADRLSVWKRYLPAPHDPETASVAALTAVLEMYKSTQAQQARA